MVGHITVKTLYTNNYIELRIQNLPEFCLNLYNFMCKNLKYLAKFLELFFELYYKNIAQILAILYGNYIFVCIG